MLPETFEAVQGGEAGLCVARPSCAPQHQAVAEHEFKNCIKKAASGVKIRMRQFVYKWFVLLFSLGGFDFLVDGGNLFANQVQFVFQLLHLLVHFVEEAAALLRTASQET